MKSFDKDMDKFTSVQGHECLKHAHSRVETSEYKKNLSVTILIINT